MATLDDSIPAAIEQSAISGSLNASMLFNFLMGIYTMVYGGTVYVYLSRMRSKRYNRLVITTISLLYLFSLLYCAVLWHILNWAFLTNGDTRDDIFWASLQYPTWIQAFLSSLTDMSMVFADGLLLWRCYHVWGESIRVIAVPSLLFCAEIGLSVTDIVLAAVIPPVTSDANADLVNNITTSQLFLSLGTTVSATVLIGYRIHTASGGIAPSKTRRYTRIVDTIVQSSMIYALAILLEALVTLIPVFDNIDSPLLQATNYIDATLMIVSGLAPTVMVLRFAYTSPENTGSSDTITHISGINFNSQQTRGGIDRAPYTSSGALDLPVHVGDTDDADKLPVIELKELDKPCLVGGSMA